MSQIKVADISRWQGTINWDLFRTAIEGVVIKAGGADGGLYTDGMLARNRNEARRVGLPVWFYWYKGGGGSARQQAEYFVNCIGGLQANEALVLDDENEGKVNPGFIAEFADRVKELTGLTIIVYSNLSRFQGVNLAVMRDRNIGAWVAKYGQNTGTVEGAGSAPGGIDASIIMWQYTSTARVAGVTANTVDMNVFYGDVAAFRAYGAKGNVPAPNPDPAPSQGVGNGTYTVVSGDTLSGIASKLGTTVDALATLNGIVNRNLIFPGQVLKVYGGSAGQASAPTNGRTYTVVRGDNLSSIGARTGVAWKTIADLNGIKDPYIIYPGQILRLTGANNAPVPAAPNTYTVVSGDYLVRIGEKTGRNWQSIASLNGIKPPYTIYPGQVLRLP
jgi:LysM repeat protein/GH25 family lysozyme M1 (1,4-beta-N-acetylmuramidase)